MGNLVKYQGFTDEMLHESKQQQAGTANNFMTLENGTNVLRFLPGIVIGRNPLFLVYTHFIPVPGRDAPAAFVCPRRMVQQRCPVCDLSGSLSRSGSKADADRAANLWPRKRFYANVIDRDDEEAGPKILSLGPMIHAQLIELRENTALNIGDYMDPEAGSDIIITKSGTGRKGTAYKVMPARQSSVLGNMAWIEAQHDLSTLVIIKSIEEIEALLRGESAGEEQPKQARRNTGGGEQQKATYKGRTVVDATVTQADDKDDFPY